MKTLFKIAKNEWLYLFYSPIAWFVLIVVWAEWAVFFTTDVYDFATGVRSDLRGVVYGIFIGGPGSGVLEQVTKNLYQVIPILTMGVINREMNNNTFPLLYSSPVKLRQIVLGKYLGILLYNLLLLVMFVVLIITSVLIIRQADYGLLLSAALGYYLMICAYSSIGLFMSTLSNYQIIAALGTFIIIFFLESIGRLWQKYDVVRDLTWFLSSRNRVDKMLHGLIISRDVIYFIIIACLFLCFTCIKLKSRTEARSWYIQAGRYLAVTAAGLLVGYICSRPMMTAYFDATAIRRNTIHQREQQLIKQFGDSVLEVTVYTNLLGGGFEFGMPEARNGYLDLFWDKYLRFKPDIRFKYEYYYDYDPASDDSALYKLYPGKTVKEIAAQLADRSDYNLSLFKSPEEMRKTIDLRPEHYRMAVQLQYRGRKEFIPFSAPPYASAFKRLLSPATIPHFYFLTGELERSIYKTGDREYSLRTADNQRSNSLVTGGFDVDTLNLAMQDIPSNTTALVLADPKMEISASIQNKLKKFIDMGGNMLIIGEPGKQYVVNPVLQQLGMQLMNGQLVKPSPNETFENVWASSTAAGGGLSEELSDLIKFWGALPVFMPRVTGIRYARDSFSFVMKPVLKTTPDDTWFKANNELAYDSTLPPYHPQQGDIKGDSFITAIQLTRQLKSKEQRVIVCSNAEFISNNWAIHSPQGSFHGDVFTAICSWLGYNEYPVYLPGTAPRDSTMKIGRAGATALQTVYVWVLPAILLLAGSVLLIRRRRK